jgi:hypothetical protein
VVPADAPDPTLSGPSAAHPQAGRPRADWAHLTPVATATRVAAPLTFDGHRFGRSVAGSRSLTERTRMLGHVHGPAGVLVDAARVDAVLPPADPADAEAVGEVQGLPVAHTLAHRKPAVTPVPARDLLASDAAVEFPRTDLAGPPPAPVTWTPDTGFVEDDPSERTPTRIIRRPRIGDAADAAHAADDGTDDADASADVGSDASAMPSVRFVPAPCPRTTRPRRPRRAAHRRQRERRRDRSLTRRQRPRCTTRCDRLHGTRHGPSPR